MSGDPLQPRSASLKIPIAEPLETTKMSFKMLKMRNRKTLEDTVTENRRILFAIT